MPGPGLDLLGDEELAELADVIRARRVSRYGPDDVSFPAKVRTLEAEVCRRASVAFALGVNAGTSALLLAQSALGIGPGDEVIVPGFTFVASISSIVYSRARPVLAEIDDSFNLDPRDVEERITERTKAIIAVHMLGSPAKLKELRAIARRYGVGLIEDAAQAFGAAYEGSWVGSIGDVGIYSFNEYKTITSGDGGMLVTNDETLYRHAFAMHDQGHSPNRKGVEIGNRPFLGLNYRMTVLSGAILLAQLRKIDTIREHLRANRDAAREIIGSVPGVTFRRSPDPDGDLATHLVVVLPTAEAASEVAREVGSITLDASGWHVYNHMEHLLAQRTATERGCPFSCETTDPRPCHYRKGMLPATDGLLARSISLSIGVQDPNLAPYGVMMRDSVEVARQRAERFTVALRRVLSA